MGNNKELLNEAEIDFLLTSAAEEDAAAAAPDEQELEQTVTMRGDLQQINLADIFQTLAMAKMEGVLRLRNPLEERQIYCQDGRVQLRVPKRVGMRRLGQRLIHAGFLTAEQLRGALIAQRKEKLPIGQLLVKQGAITRDQVDEIVNVQIAEDLFSLFTWKHGSFEFYKHEAGSSAAGGFAGCPEFEVSSLLLEVARRSDEWESICDAIGTLEEVPIRIADPEDESALTEAHAAMLASIDGNTTYRDLAEQTTFGLFEAARAARDLVRGGLCTNVDDEALVATAKRAAVGGFNKKAVLLLQTLRDRPGDRSLNVLQAMAAAMQQVGEKRLGGQLLLEAAQRHPDGATALTLARTAHALAPHDPEVISFLRTVLVAHGSLDSEELESCTLQLLDALIEVDQLQPALDIVDDARRTGSIRPQILVREARARQKARDIPGAVDALFELGQHFEAQNDRPHAIETYRSLLRLDRSRKDVQKLVNSLQRTRLGNVIRIGAAFLAAAMFGGMGFVLWQQHTFEAQVREATSEISSLLEAGNRAEAASRLADWQTQLGNCEPMDDLRSRVAFAESAELQRVQKQKRAVVNEQLTSAADLLGRGEIEAALKVYAPLWQRADLRAEIDKIVVTRFDVLIANLEQAAKALTNNMPPMPGKLFDRRDLTTRLDDLRSICPPVSLRLITELRTLQEAKALPEFLGSAQRARIDRLVANSKDIFERAGELTAAYTKALERNNLQRELNPLFQAAVEHEKAHDFKQALECYRELERQPDTDSELRAHFRERVARNATIVKLMGALDDATGRGDFATAQQQLRALRLSFPDVPFGQIARLPLRVESQPTGALVTCNGAEVGRTPLLLARIPEQETRLQASLDGFVSETGVIQDDSTAGWTARMVLGPDATWKHGSAIDVAPVRDADGTLFLVDRAGVVTARNESGERGNWTFRSGDLSGLLTRPILHGGKVLVGSLDGQLRALDAGTGQVAWSLPDLPTETSPLLIEGLLVLAANDGTLHTIDLDAHQALHRVMPQPVWGNLVNKGRRVFVLGDRALAMAFDLPGLDPAWQKPIEHMGHGSTALAGDALIVADDRGNVAALACDQGAVRWQHALECEVIGAPMAIRQGVLLVTPQALLVLDPANGNELRRLPREDQDWLGSPVLIGNRLVVALHDGPLQVVDTDNLQPLYRLHAPRRSRYLAFGEAMLLVMPDHGVAEFHRLR